MGMTGTVSARRKRVAHSQDRFDEADTGKEMRRLF